MSEARIICGNALDVLATLPAASVHSCVSSPPYWGLRDYKLEPQVWGGDPACEHAWGEYLREHHPGQVEQSKWKNAEAAGAGQTAKSGQFCLQCSAWRGSLGLEPTPQLYIEHLVAVFRAVRRVLRPDGVLWVNLGDCYVTKPIGSSSTGFRDNRTNNPASIGYVSGDLVGVPWLFALAMRADGWVLRSENIWHKKSPMPESVQGWSWERHRLLVRSAERRSNARDLEIFPHNKPRAAHNGSSFASSEWRECPGCPKCAANDGLVLRKGSWRTTRSHEQVFQFTLPGPYFCDALGAREPTTGAAHSRGNGLNPKAVPMAPGVRQNTDWSRRVTEPVPTRNLRSVWQLGSEPYQGSHYATFPTALVRPMLLASTSERGCCPTCGAPWVRILKREFRGDWHSNQELKRQGINAQFTGRKAAEYIGKWGDRDPKSASRRMLKNVKAARAAGGGHDNPFEPPVGIGWRASCSCDGAGDPVPCTVLDPFAGAGTTGVVALRYGRNFIGIELNPSYCAMAERRLQNVQPLLESAVAVPAEPAQPMLFTEETDG